MPSSPQVWKTVRAALGDGEICDRCGATIDTYAEVCTATDLTDDCPGFVAIEAALKPTGRNGG